MGSHKKHKYYKKKSKKSKKHKKPKMNLKEVHEKLLKNEKKYSNLMSALTIKDKKVPLEKRSRSDTSDDSRSSPCHADGDRRKLKYKYKKSRSSSLTSSSSSTTTSSSSSSSSPSSSSSSSSSSDEKATRKATKHRKKKLKKEEKKKKIEVLNRKYEENRKAKVDVESVNSGKKNMDDFSYDKKRMKKMKLSNDIVTGPLVPDSLLQKSKAMAPMSREEWEKKQNEIRRVYDQETGRYRLIKGDGEVLEEIVNRSRHKEINKQATAGDGNFFQSTLAGQIKK